MHTSPGAIVFSEWLRRQGYKVVQTGSSYWFTEAHGVYQAFPHHWLICPDQGELSELYYRHHARALRYSSPEDVSNGDPSYHVVCQTTNFDFASVNSSTRRNVRDGLKKCLVERISFDRLLGEGWPISCETEKRQGRNLGITYNEWAHSNKSAADLDGFEVWGALVGGILAAFIVSFQMDECCYMLYQRSLDRYLSHHVNHALSFSWMKTMLSRSGITSLFNGMQPLDAPGTVDSFKFRLGYEPKPIRQCVQLHPWLAPFSRPIHGSLRIAKLLWPHSPTLSKAEGLTRIHIASKGALRLRETAVNSN
ncbi:MAG: hypothetical protein JO061_04515 [Acidobacteriaceae bacterium]|nr:hypothetical protein [Acidobacteriaceae bacterium]